MKRKKRSDPYKRIDALLKKQESQIKTLKASLSKKKVVKSPKRRKLYKPALSRNPYMGRRRRPRRTYTRSAKRVYRRSRGFLAIPKSPKAIFNKTAAGVGGAVVASSLAAVVGFDHPIVPYGGAFIAGGPVGLLAKFGFDMLTGGGLPFGISLGGQAAGNVVV